MLAKRIQSKVESLLGVSDFRWKHLPNGVYVLNLHRIGDVASSKLDPNVYSCSAEKLQQHLTYLKQYFDIISLSELIDLVSNKSRADGKYLVVTFDDGYRDNFELAYPILKSLKIPAVFFIATGLIENAELPWWDKVAYLIQRSHIKKIKLPYWKETVELTGNRQIFVRLILNQIKQSTSPICQQITDIENFVGMPTAYPNSEFMTWEHIRELSANGMDIGAHSHSHDILAKLDDEQMLFELSHSKSILEEKLGKKVRAFSYPVGSKNTYNDSVIEALINNGYEIAFNFHPGVNVNLSKNRYDLCRFPIEYMMDDTALKKMLTYAKRI